MCVGVCGGAQAAEAEQARGWEGGKGKEQWEDGVRWGHTQGRSRAELRLWGTEECPSQASPNLLTRSAQAAVKAS